MSPQAGELLVQEIAPRIRHCVPGSVPQIGADDIDELVQDGIAIAAVLLCSAQARGKKVTPGNIAYYAIGHLRQGRRSTGFKKADALHPAAQLSGHSVVSLDAPLTSKGDGEEIMCLHDVLESRSEDPATTATRRLDWDTLMSFLDAMAREILHCLMQGEDLTTLVPRLKRSRSSLQTDKERLARLVREHLGEDVLQRVQERPGWMNNLQANREKVACRLERQLPT